MDDADDREKNATIADDRFEYRTIVASGEETRFYEGMREQLYGRPYVTTLYFGKNGPLEAGTDPFLTAARIKVRSYSSQDVETNPFFSLDTTQLCLVEFKSRAGDGTRRTFKRRFTDVSLDQVLQVFEDPMLFIARNENERLLAERVKAVYRENSCTSLRPIGATSYRRRHFLADDVHGTRVTVDTSVRIWTLAKIKNLWVVAETVAIGGVIVEAKSFSIVERFSQSQPSIPKFEYIRQAVLKGTMPVMTFPGKIPIQNSQIRDGNLTEYVEEEHEVKPFFDSSKN